MFKNDTFYIGEILIPLMIADKLELMAVTTSAEEIMKERKTRQERASNPEKSGSKSVIDLAEANGIVVRPEPANPDILGQAAQEALGAEVKQEVVDVERQPILDLKSIVENPSEWQFLWLNISEIFY